jgi:cytochrome c556
MSTHRLALASAVLAALVAGGDVAAQSAADTVAARQSQFKLLAFNIGPLVGMTQGNIPYDAAMAQAAADNLVAIASLDQSRMWPEGTDNMAMEGTRALPAIWDDLEDFATKLEALRSAAGAMQVAAGQDLDALRAALGPVGGACSACHEANRAPQ